MMWVTFWGGIAALCLVAFVVVSFLLYWAYGLFKDDMGSKLDIIEKAVMFVLFLCWLVAGFGIYTSVLKAIELWRQP